jgi:hypothetical protein
MLNLFQHPLPQRNIIQEILKQFANATFRNWLCMMGFYLNKSPEPSLRGTKQSPGSMSEFQTVGGLLLSQIKLWTGYSVSQ